MVKRVNTLDYEEGSDKVLFLFKHIKTEHFKLSISGFMANSVLCSSVGGVLYLSNSNSGCHLSGIETINCFLELVNWSSASAIDHPLRPVIHIDRALKITRQPHFPCMWFCSTGISFHWSLVMWAVTLLCSIHLKACVLIVTPPYCLTVARRQLRVGGSSR